MSHGADGIAPQAGRVRLSLALRTFPGWERLRAAIAHALDLPLEQVRGLTERADPAVRLEATAFALGFRSAVDLFIDPLRTTVPPRAALALALARGLGVDVAHHDGSADPFGYIVVRPTGERFAATEIDDDSDGLHLDEAPESLVRLPDP